MRKATWVISTLLIIIITAMLIGFGMRERILKSNINQIIESQRISRKLDIAIQGAGFEGLAAVRLQGITVVPEGRDSLLYLDNIKVRIHLLPLLTGSIKIAEVESENAVLTLSKKNGVRNFDFLLKKEKKDSTKQSGSKLNLARIADNLINDLLYKIPEELFIRNYVLKVIDEEEEFEINATKIHIQNETLNSTFVLNNNEAVWHAEGHIAPSDQQLNIRFYASEKKAELPYIEKKFGLKLNFDTIATRMDDIRYESGILKIFGNWSIKNLVINHEKISSKDVSIPDAHIDCNMFVGENYISIDSSSTAYLSEIVVHPYIKYTLGKSQVYELNLKANTIPAQDFFDSFPKGLFESFDGIQLQGNLTYLMDFYLDASEPWKCKFNSELRKENFKILKPGNTGFQKINGVFSHIPYEYGRAGRTILVGPGNPYYTPYEEISDYLKNAVLTSEDPSFFSHRGFYTEAFRQSIATNFVSGKFKRGGSTISMQLVKNIFLNRQKTITRKLEEILIVWLIEQNRLSDKQRMYEVYLNIIEWAPDVYGIGEASRFYFNKKPSELNLGESIFLASIVPKPKKFKYSFQGNGNMKPYLRSYFNLIGGLMVKRNKINESDTSGMFTQVRLKGPAKDFVLADTLIHQPGEDFDEEIDVLRSLLGE